MNPVIQSLVQSPYVRTMSAIPSKSEELVHGVENFLPPLSRTKVVIRPSTGRLSGEAYRFEIPRRDYLDRLELVFRCRVPSTANPVTVGATSISDVTSALDSVTSGLSKAMLSCKQPYSNLISSIELYSKNRFIERLDPEAIWHEEAIRNDTEDAGSGLDFHYTYLTNIIDPTSGSKSGLFHPFPVRSSTLFSFGLHSLTDLRNAQFHLPLPFCSTSMLKKNFQTNFLETLQVVVNTKWCKLFQLTAANGYDMQLVATYHQFHPNVETVIRNANYKPGIPATLPWWEWVEFTQRVTQGLSVIQYQLDSDYLISELMLVPSFGSSLDSGTVTFDWTRQNFYFVLTTDNQVIFEGDARGLMSDGEYNLADNEVHMRRNHYEDNNLVIRFGLQYGEIFTGGLAISSLNNVVISIYSSEAHYRGLATVLFPPGSTPIAPFDFRILGKRHYMLRIDSDTGVVSRAIDA